MGVTAALLQGPELVTKDWAEIIEAASKSPLGILALMILALATLAYVFFKDADSKIKACKYLAMLAGVIAYGVAISRANSDVTRDASYRVRVIVADEHQISVSDHSWSSIGGEPLKVDGGWLFVIAADTKPLDGKVTLYASKDASFLKGEAPLQLTGDHNPSVTVALDNPRKARVFGSVQDKHQSSIVGATVSVIGYDSEAEVTKQTGSFSLPAHAADGQQVQLHAEKPGYQSANQWCPAGSTPCVIQLPRR